MAYHQEKNGDIVIDGFENGIAGSPYTGFQFIQGMNITGFPKGTYVNTKRAQASYGASAPSIYVTYIVQDPITLSNLYALDYLGNPWISTNSGYTWAVVSPTLSPTNPHGNGLVIFNSYLLVISDAQIWAISVGPSGITGTWTNMKTNFPLGGGSPSAPMFQLTTQTTGINHMTIVAEDTKMYICNGNFIAQLSVINPSVTPFDPTNPSTYNFNEQALTLPANTYPSSVATYLCELRNELVIAAGNRVYTWDKVSTSFDTSIPFSEPIGKVLNLKNSIYCFSGTPTINSTIPETSIVGRGTIYSYNGSFASVLTKIPDSLSNGFDTNLWTFGGIMAHVDKIYFGLSNNNNPFITGIFSVDPQGSNPNLQAVTSGPLNGDYADPYQEGLTTALLSLDNIQTGSDNTIVNFASAYNDTLNSLYGFAILDTNNTPGIGTIVTDLIPVGLFLTKKAFKQIEIVFNSPISQNEIFNLASRQGYNMNSTTIGSHTGTASETQLSYVFPFNSQGFQWVQIIVGLTSVVNGSRLPIREIRLR